MQKPTISWLQLTSLYLGHNFYNNFQTGPQNYAQNEVLANTVVKLQFSKLVKL